MEVEVGRKVVSRRKVVYVVVCRRQVYVVGEKEEVACVAWCVYVSSSSAVMKYPRRSSYADWALTQ